MNQIKPWICPDRCETLLMEIFSFYPQQLFHKFWFEISFLLPTWRNVSKFWYDEKILIVSSESASRHFILL